MGIILAWTKLFLREKREDGYSSKLSSISRNKLKAKTIEPLSIQSPSETPRCSANTVKIQTNSNFVLNSEEARLVGGAFKQELLKSSSHESIEDSQHVQINRNLVIYEGQGIYAEADFI